MDGIFLLIIPILAIIVAILSYIILDFIAEIIYKYFIAN
jgi:hypothetical protein